MGGVKKIIEAWGLEVHESQKTATGEHTMHVDHEVKGILTNFQSHLFIVGGAFYSAEDVKALTVEELIKACVKNGVTVHLGFSGSSLERMVSAR